MTTNHNDVITRFREQFSTSPDLIHFNNAGQALMCRPAFATITTWAKRFQEEGAHVFPPLIAAIQDARSSLADFLGCKSREISYFTGASGAISQVALGLPLKPDDEIIVWDQEYPSNLFPWKVAADRGGAKLIVAKSESDLSTPLAGIEKLVTPRTRVIATSWVQYRTGAIMDLNELTAFARARGIFTCADIIQGAGVLPFNFADTGLDAACGGSHKWMVSSHGAGFLVLREEHFEKIEPLMVGAMTFGGPDDTVDLEAKPKTDPKRFEPGGMAFLEVLALGASAKLLRETGIAMIAQEDEWLARKLLHGLRERGYIINSPHGKHHRGAIVNFSPSDDSRLKTISEIETRLHEKRVSFGKRKPGIRLSPHAFNTLDDIERVLSVL